MKSKTKVILACFVIGIVGFIGTTITTRSTPYSDEKIFYHALLLIV